MVLIADGRSFAVMVQEAGWFVGIDDPYSLEEGVDDCGAHEFHSAAAQVGRDGVRPCGDSGCVVA